MKKKFVIILGACIGLISCSSINSDSVQRIEKSPVNYIVLLDLSDRLTDPEQTNRDIQIVISVFEEFNAQVRRNLVINSRDRFQVVIAPQKGISYKTDSFENSLFIDMAALNAGAKLEALDNFSKNLNVELKKLYAQAYLGDRTTDYPGAGIWMFFNEQLEYLASKTHDNRLVVISDGYFDLEDYGKQLPSENRYPTTSFLAEARGKINWREILEGKNMGLIPVGKEFNNLKIIVSEINPKYDFQYESDMLSYVWKKWCKEMKADGINVIVRTSLPQAIALLRANLSSGS